MAEYVTVNDGLSPTNILFFDVKTGAIAGRHPVTFGCKDVTSNCNSTTDQSITVKGYRAVVVNNWVADSVTPFCSEFFASLPVTESLKHECPFMFGAFVNGVEQFEINPLSKDVKSVWFNNEVWFEVKMIKSRTNLVYSDCCCVILYLAVDGFCCIRICCVMTQQ